MSQIAGRNIGATEYLHRVIDLSSYYDVCGDIHGVSPHEFSELNEAFGDRFRGAHLIAHPIVRFAGSLAISKEMGRHFTRQDFLTMWGLDRAHPISVALLPILGENDDHVPAHYMMHVNGIVRIVRSQPMFKLEALMGADEEWRAMVDYLSGNTITNFGNTWRQLRGVFIGIAHQPFAVGGPRTVWNSLPPEVKKVVSTILADQARDEYASSECVPSAHISRRKRRTSGTISMTTSGTDGAADVRFRIAKRTSLGLA